MPCCQCCRKKHHAGQSIAEPMAKAIAYLTGLAWPALVGTAIFAEPIILFLFGPQWLESTPLVRIICAIAFINTPFTFTILALQAIGRPYLAAVPGAFQLLFSAIAILMLFDQSLVSFAYALLAANLATLPIYLWLQHHHLRFPIQGFLSALTISIHLTLAMAALLAVLAWLLGGLPPWEQVVLAFFISMFSWGTLVSWLSHPIRDEIILLGKKIPLLQHFFNQS